MPFRGVIHAVGPRMGEGDEEEQLTAAIASDLARAAERAWGSAARPAVSSGIFRVPLDVWARAYVAGVRRHGRDWPDTSVRRVVLCLREGPIIDAVRREVEVWEHGSGEAGLG